MSHRATLLRGLSVAALAVIGATGAAESQRFGLDLDTPTATVDAFADAWWDGDFALAFMAMDPPMQRRFEIAYFMVHLDRLVPNARGQEEALRVLDDADAYIDWEFSVEHEPVTRMDAHLHAVMRSAEAAGIPAISIQPGVVAERSGTGDDRVLLQAQANETLVFHLVESRSGAWRITGIESDARTLPVTWLPPGD